MKTTKTEPRIETKSPLKADLIHEVKHWKWTALALSENIRPLVMIPGLIVYLETSDLTDLEERIEVLNLALKIVKSRPVPQPEETP